MMNFQFWLVLKIVKGTIQYKITNIVTDSHMESSGCLHTLWEGSLLLLDPLLLPMLLPQGGHRETVTITHRHISLFLFRKTQNHNPLTLRKSTLTWLLPPGNRLYRLFLSHSCWALSFQLTIQRQLACSLSLYLYTHPFENGIVLSPTKLTQTHTNKLFMKCYSWHSHFGFLMFKYNNWICAFTPLYIRTCRKHRKKWNEFNQPH